MRAPEKRAGDAMSGRRRTAALIGLVASAAALLPLAPAAEAAQRRQAAGRLCGEPGTTVLQNRLVRVYVVPGPRGDGGEMYLACGVRGARERQIGGSTLEGDHGERASFRLAGWYVAWDGAECYYERCAGGVEVLNVRTGRRTRDEVPTVPVGPLAGIGTANSLLLEPDGTTAWIRTRPEGPPPPNGVYAMAFGGQARLLDAGVAVDPASLASNGRTLYWLRGGVPQAAPLR